MPTRTLMNKKQIRFISMKLLFATLLSSCGLILFTPSAKADDAVIQGNGACWFWRIDITGDEEGDIGELTIYEKCDEEDRINWDGYDSFGIGSVGGRKFDWSLANTVFVNGVLAGNQIVIPGEAGTTTEGSTYTITFSQNNVTYLINSTSPLADLRITGNLGSDSGTTFMNLGPYFISYQDRNDNNGIPSEDPIFLWESNVTLTPDRDGSTTLEKGDQLVRASITGNTLQIKHYAYAHKRAGFTSSGEFFNSFLKFVQEDKNRTDVFTIDWRPQPTVALRQTSNLSFDQSQYGSDTLSDPDGQLRKTIDSINAKYGNLLR